MINAALLLNRLRNGGLEGTRFAAMSDDDLLAAIIGELNGGINELASRFQMHTQEFLVDPKDFIAEGTELVYPFQINFDPDSDPDFPDMVAQIQMNTPNWQVLDPTATPYRAHKEILEVRDSCNRLIPFDNTQGIFRTSVNTLIFTELCKNIKFPLKITCSAYPKMFMGDQFGELIGCCARRDIVTYTGDATLKYTDMGCIIECDSDTDMTLTVPAFANVAFGSGALFYIVQIGTGSVTLEAAEGVTLETPLGKIANKDSGGFLYRRMTKDDFVFVLGGGSGYKDYHFTPISISPPVTTILTADEATTVITNSIPSDAIPQLTNVTLDSTNVSAPIFTGFAAPFAMASGLANIGDLDFQITEDASVTLVLAHDGTINPSNVSGAFGGSTLPDNVGMSFVTYAVGGDSVAMLYTRADTLSNPLPDITQAHLSINSGSVVSDVGSSTYDSDKYNHISILTIAPVTHSSNNITPLHFTSTLRSVLTTYTPIPSDAVDGDALIIQGLGVNGLPSTINILGSQVNNTDYCVLIDNKTALQVDSKVAIQKQTYTAYGATGTGTSYSLGSIQPPVVEYLKGLSFFVNFPTTSGNNPTLSLSGLTNPPQLVKQMDDGSYINIAAGDIPAGHNSRVTLISPTQAWVETLTKTQKHHSIEFAPLSAGADIVEQAAFNSSGHSVLTSNSPNFLLDSAGDPAPVGNFLGTALKFAMASTNVPSKPIIGTGNSMVLQVLDHVRYVLFLQDGSITDDELATKLNANDFSGLDALTFMYEVSASTLYFSTLDGSTTFNYPLTPINSVAGNLNILSGMYGGVPYLNMLMPDGSYTALIPINSARPVVSIVTTSADSSSPFNQLSFINTLTYLEAGLPITNPLPIGLNDGDTLKIIGLTAPLPTSTTLLGSAVKNKDYCILQNLKTSIEVIPDVLQAIDDALAGGTTADYFRGDLTWQPLNKSAVGLGNVDNTTDLNKPISNATQAALDGKEPTITAGTTSQYWRGDKTWQTLDKNAVGLSNVDNTSDVNKPVSTAQAAADATILASAKSYADGLVVGLFDFRGNYDASTGVFPSTGGSGSAGAVLKSDIWRISVVGTIAGVQYRVGDALYATVDSPAQTAANWGSMLLELGYNPLGDVINGATVGSSVSLVTTSTALVRVIAQLTSNTTDLTVTAASSAGQPVTLGLVGKTLKYWQEVSQTISSTVQRLIWQPLDPNGTFVRANTVQVIAVPKAITFRDPSESGATFPTAFTSGLDIQIKGTAGTNATYATDGYCFGEGNTAASKGLAAGYRATAAASSVAVGNTVSANGGGLVFGLSSTGSGLTIGNTCTTSGGGGAMAFGNTVNTYTNFTVNLCMGYSISNSGALSASNTLIGHNITSSGSQGNAVLVGVYINATAPTSTIVATGKSGIPVTDQGISDFERFGRKGGIVIPPTSNLTLVTDVTNTAWRDVAASTLLSLDAGNTNSKFIASVHCVMTDAGTLPSATTTRRGIIRLEAWSLTSGTIINTVTNLEGGDGNFLTYIALRLVATGTGVKLQWQFVSDPTGGAATPKVAMSFFGIIDAIKLSPL